MGRVRLESLTYEERTFAMLEMLAPGTSLAWDLLWQSCLFLSLGLGASLALRLRPARAHRVLVLAMLGALLTPVLSQAIRRVGWGVLKQPEPAASVAETAPATARAPAPETSQVPVVRVSQPPGRPRDVDHAREAPQFASGRRERAVVPAPLASPIPWRGVALVVWAGMTLLAFLRLAASFARGCRLVRRSPALED